MTGLQELVFPPVCILCGDDGIARLDLCAPCRRDLPTPGPSCASCGHPLPRPGPLCGYCLSRPPVWSRLVVALDYAMPVDWLVCRFKFHGAMSCGRTLAHLLSDAVRAAPAPRPEAIVPVPLHPMRLRERGFNQSARLAAWMGRELDLDVDASLLERTRPTRAQMELPARSRRGNVRNAFRCRRAPAGRHLALVDDVFTTGHTAGECAGVLLAAGARRVDLWTVARTPGAGRATGMALCA